MTIKALNHFASIKTVVPSAKQVLSSNCNEETVKVQRVDIRICVYRDTDRLGKLNLYT